MPPEDFYIKLICQGIEEKFNRGAISLWKNNDYIILSGDIFEKTKTNISADTLKRIFGKKKNYKEDSTPQFSTKNALALYLGFSDWETFKKTAEIAEIPDIVTEKKVKRTIISAKTAIIATVGSLLSGLMVWVFLFTKPKHDYAFSASPRSGLAPLNVKFNFDLPEASTDEYSVAFDYHSLYFSPLSLEAKVKSPMKEAFESYRLPGWYKPRLKKKGEIVDSSEVLILSDKKWVGIVNDHLTGYFIPLPYRQKGGLMYYDPKYLEKNDFTVRLQYFTEFRYFDTIPITGDQCKFEVKLKNNLLTGGTSCYDIVVVLVCEKGNLRIHFVEPGCQKWCQMDFSEVHLDGRYQDLIAFGQKFDTFRTVSLSAENNRADISLDGNRIFTQKYLHPVGKVKGMMVRFKGCGIVDKILLKGKTDSLNFDFD